MAKMDNPIVLGMCSTARHDFGLDKTGDNFTCGMTDQERERLYSEMDQLYYHNSRPVIEKLEAELDTMTDEIEKLKAENVKLMAELRHERDTVQRYQNNGNF